MNRLPLYIPLLCGVIVLLIIAWGEWDRFAPGNEHPGITGNSNIDPVCRMEVSAQLEFSWKGDPYFFCTDRCRDLFSESPQRYTSAACIVCRANSTVEAASVLESPFEATWQGATYALCSEEHRAAFIRDPAGFFMHTMWGIPSWMYYSSIAFVLVVSFLFFERRKSVVPVLNTGMPSAPPRIDLLQTPWIRRALVHPRTRFFARLFFVGAFALVIATGLFGNQIPSKNIAPLLTWTLWWSGLIVFVLYAGSAWCYVCPWEAIADWAEGLRFWGRRKEGMGLELRLPKRLRNIWPAIALFLALTWIELGFGITFNPRATAWFALGMVGLAFVCAFLFERRIFCRYGCFVGRIIGMYSMFSPVEIRAKDRDVCRTCKTKSCYRGNDDGEPCPTSEYLPAMTDSSRCISCLECVKSCEAGNVGLLVRPWGEDLPFLRRARSDEAWLALVLLALTGFHGLTMTGVWPDWLAWMRSNLHLSETLAFSAGMALIVVAPCLVYALLVDLSRRMGAREVRYKIYFMRYAYALLPIALFYHLAHNSEHLLMEGQKILPLLSDPFGWEWDLFGTAQWAPAPLVSLSTLWLVQIFLVAVGHVYSLWVARGVSRDLFRGGNATRSQLPMLAAMVLFSVVSLWLLKQPMEMRMSAM